MLFNFNPPLVFFFCVHVVVVLAKMDQRPGLDVGLCELFITISS
jgi:hypothetical protein